MKSRKFLYSLTSIVLTSFLVSVFIVFAADPGTPFAPGDNVQDPGDPGSAWGGCGPTDPNCYVTVAAGSASFGTDNQIPFTNLAGNDFDYSGNLTFDGSTLTLTGDQNITGDLVVNTDDLIVDALTGNVGIGDATPSALFTVGNGDLFKVTSAGTISSVVGITSSSNYIQSAGTMSLTSANTTQLATSSIFALNGNSLTSGTGFYATSSSLSLGSLMNLNVNSTAAISNLQRVLYVSTSGLNSNSGQTTYGGYFSNTHTSAGSATNRAIYATSSGGTTNTAMYATASGGNIAIGLYATASGGSTTNYAAHIDGTLALGSGNPFLIQTFSDQSLSLGAGTPPSVTGTLLFGTGAGTSATNAQNSNFLGQNSGGNATNASDSNFLGDSAGYGATNANYSNFLGIRAGYNASAADHSNFFGLGAGNSATNAEYSNFIGAGAGYGATNSSYANFIGISAGQDATDAAGSIFIGQSAGIQATSASYGVFLGAEAGGYANGATNSVFIGTGAGYIGFGGSNASNSIFIGESAGWKASGTSNASNSIFIGENAGINDTVDNTTGGYSILLGPDTDTGNFSNSIAMGRGATNTTSNQLVFGSDDANSSIGTVFFGTGVTATTPAGVVINGSGASGTDIAGASLTFAGGKATGNAAGGSILFQTSNAGASGSTLQSLTTKAVILANGNFGISNSNPGVALHVGSASTTDATTLLRLQDANSTCNFTADAGAPTCGSDFNLKKDIEELSTREILAGVVALEPVSYHWKTDSNSDPLQYGFIAQNVQEQFPNLVKEGTWIDGSQKLFLSMGGLMPYAIGAIKELDIKLRDLSEIVETKKLCLGETCVTEEELKILLQNAGLNSENENSDSGKENTETIGGDDEVAPQIEDDIIDEPNLEEVIVQEENTNDEPEEIINQEEEIQQNEENQGSN